MIIKVPESKKIRECGKPSFTPLNEGFFDEAPFDGDDESTGDATAIAMSEVERTRVPEVERFLMRMDVTNYTVNCTGHGIVVDVHDHLFLPNRNLRSFSGFSFGDCDGDCDFAGNKFDDFKWFPRHIGGDCIANFNRITDFSHAPIVLGAMLAKRQRVRTNYPLTDEMYRKYMSGELQEQLCTDLSDGEQGLLESISDGGANCVLRMFNGDVRTVATNMVDCDLFI